MGAAGVPWDMECGEFISQMSTWGGSSRGRARLTLRCAGASLLCEAACVASDLDDALLHPHRRNCYAPVGTPSLGLSCAGSLSCRVRGRAYRYSARGLWSLPICCHRVPSWFVLLFFRLVYGCFPFGITTASATGDFPGYQKTRETTHPMTHPPDPAPSPRMSSKPTLRRAPWAMDR